MKHLYVSDVKLALKLGLLKPGALIVGDNIKTPGAPEFLEFVTKPALQRQFVLEELEAGTDNSDTVLELRKVLKKHGRLFETEVESTFVEYHTWLPDEMTISVLLEA